MHPTMGLNTHMWYRCVHQKQDNFNWIVLWQEVMVIIGNIQLNKIKNYTFFTVLYQFSFADKQNQQISITIYHQIKVQLVQLIGINYLDTQVVAKIHTVLLAHVKVVKLCSSGKICFTLCHEGFNEPCYLFVYQL